MIEAGALASAGVGLSMASGPALAKDQYDPRKSSAGLVKLEAYADGRPAPWWYTGTIYAVRERTKPKALFRFEGSETYWASPKSSGEADVYSRTITFFRDVDTNQWLDAYDNPLTGQRNALRPNVLRGQSVFPADGGAPRLKMAGPMTPTEIAPQGFEATDPNKPTGGFKWIVLGDMVLRIGDRAAPSKLQPSMEAQSTFGDAKAFFDPRAKAMGAQFTSTTFSPYMGWMKMADEPGHLIWHASGYKTRGFTELPAEYRARAEAILPGALMGAPG
jgi:hypothetical protein